VGEKEKRKKKLCAVTRRRTRKREKERGERKNGKIIPTAASKLSL
jgi:hypothetical protein